MKPNSIIQGDALEVLKTLPSESVDCAITSPPYWNLRDYSMEGQLGLEPTFQEYISKLCDIFDEVKRVLKPDGTCWVNMGDTYGGSGKGVSNNGTGKTTLGGGTKKLKQLAKENWKFEKRPITKDEIQKSLLQIPSRFAIEMSNRGWILRNEIIWHKPNCMPSSAEDRFTVDFEKVFFFVKSKKYHFEQQLDPYTQDLDRWGGTMVRGDYTSKTEQFAVEERAGRNMRPNEEGKNKRTVWRINTKGFPEAHFATFPEALVEPMIKAGCPKDGMVMDIFMGSGTTAIVALQLDRKYIGIELNPEYIKIAEDRLKPLKSRLF